MAYTGRSPGRPVYRCDRPNLERGLPRCLTFGARADAAIAAETLRVVEPMAIEAAQEAERMRTESDAEGRRMAGLDLRQARLTRRRWPSAGTPPATPTTA